LGDGETARKLDSFAADQLTPLGESVHDWLLQAFTHRVEQAIAGRPHDGSWPDGFVAALDRVGRGREPGDGRVYRFVVDNLRTYSRILEPVERVDPYSPWKQSTGGPEWFRRGSTPGRPGESLEATYTDLLQLADHAGPGAGIGSMVHPNGTGRFVAALEAAQRAELTELVDARLQDLLGLVAGRHAAAGRQLYLLLSLSKALIRLGRKSEAATLADEHRAPEVAEYRRSRDVDRLVICMAMAALDLWLGRPESAAPILDLARQEAPRVEPAGIRPRVIAEYFEAIAWAPWPNLLENLRSMLTVLPHFPNTRTTADWYSVRHLEIVERVSLAITTYNFGPPDDLRQTMPDAEIASRREALAEVRGKLVEWGQKDWGPGKSP
jgi:hypothetical protein